MAKKGRIGLDIGSTAVRAVELLGSPPTVVRASQVALPAGAVESGEVRDPGAVSDALHKLWSEGGFKGRQVYLGVGNQRVVVREISLPYLPEKELRSFLGFQVQEFIPMPVDDAVLDYHTIGEFEQDDRKMLRMLLVAAQRSMVDLVVQAVSGAKLEPLGIDLVPFALVRSVGASDQGLDLEDGQVEEAIVDIGAHVTNIVVHGRGETRFVRILPSGDAEVGRSARCDGTIWNARVGSAWFGVAPKVSLVARDWGTARSLAGGPLAVTDAIRVSRSSRMVLSRIRLGEGRVVPFTQLGLGQWRVDTEMVPHLPRNVELAAQFGAGVEMRLYRGWELAAETDLTVLYREVHEPQQLTTPRMWGAFLASRVEF
jgi:hypothetical protein